VLDAALWALPGEQGGEGPANIVATLQSFCFLRIEYDPISILVISHVSIYLFVVANEPSPSERPPGSVGTPCF
jgi:hypothetical protein